MFWRWDRRPPRATFSRVVEQAIVARVHRAIAESFDEKAYLGGFDDDALLRCGHSRVGAAARYVAARADARAEPEHVAVGAHEHAASAADASGLCEQPAVA